MKEVFAANPKTIVVIASSFPHAIDRTQRHVPAIVHMAHNSQEMGNALADVLFGDYNPAGRRVHTWPQSEAQLPPMMDYDIRHGRTYMYFNGDPLYPFGFGLSYTTFEYSNLRLSATQMPAAGKLSMDVDVANTGGRHGEEVVQAYAAYPDSKIARPLRQLIGFQRVAVPAHQRRTFSIPLTADLIAYWDEAAQQFMIEAGTVKIMVGPSSADVRLTKSITVAAGPAQQ